MNVLLYGILFNAVTALLLNGLILFILGVCLKLFQARLTPSLQYIISVAISCGISLVTLIIFFQGFCIRYECSVRDFIFGLTIVTILILLITYLGYFSLKLGYGKQLSGKK